MKRLMITTTALCALALPALADRPRGWSGLYEVYGCEPDQWRKTSQNIWNNPTCQGPGSIALAAKADYAATNPGKFAWVMPETEDGLDALEAAVIVLRDALRADERVAA